MDDAMLDQNDCVLNLTLRLCPIEILNVSIYRGNKVFFNDVGRHLGKFVMDSVRSINLLLFSLMELLFTLIMIPQISDDPHLTLPSSLKLERRWRKLLAARKIRKADMSSFRVNHFHAAERIHRAVKAAIFRNDVKEKVQKAQNLVTTFVHKEAQQLVGPSTCHEDNIENQLANEADMVQSFEVDDLLQVADEILSSILGIDTTQTH